MSSVTTKDIQNLYSNLSCLIKSNSSSEGVLLELQNIVINTFGSLENTNLLIEQKTPTSIATSSTVTIPIGATEVSVFNNGDLTGSVNGTVIPAGVTRNFGFKNPIETTISVNGTGTELIIDYML